MEGEIHLICKEIAAKVLAERQGKPPKAEKREELKIPVEQLWKQKRGEETE